VTGATSRGVARGLVVASVLALASIGVAACGPAGSSAAPSSAVALSPAVASPAEITSQLDGQVVKLDTEGLTKVRGFTLRTDSGQEVAFKIGVLENGAQFPPGHLAEHMATGSAVRVTFSKEGDALVVTRIEDAPAP
jgi:hypothetical protein